MPGIIIGTSAYKKLLDHVCATDFQYETGGVMLGYKCLGVFYVIAFTFPQNCEKATRTCFVLNGKEQTEDMRRIAGSFFFPPRLMKQL